MYCRLSIAIAAFLLVMPVATQAQEKAKDKLRYGQIDSVVRSSSSLVLYTAQRKGFLARENIELDVVLLPGVHHMVEALDDNRVDVSYVATPYLIEGALKGSKAVGIIGAPANIIFSLMAKPEIKSIEQLKGKMVAMSLPVDTISIATRLLLAKHGLKEGDYRTTQLVGTAPRANCLTGGECDAVPLGQPDDILLADKGYTKVGDSLEVIPVLQFGMVAARSDWAAQHKDLAVRFARAFGDAYRFIRDPKNRNEAIAILADTTGAPPDLAGKILAFYFEPDRGVLPKQAEISIPGITAVIELLSVTGKLNAPLPSAERFVDLQYLKAAGLQ